MENKDDLRVKNGGLPPSVGEFAVEDRQRLLAKVEEQARKIAALKAQPSGVVPAALGSAFITCESGDAGYRVVIKSETLQETQQVYNWLSRLNSSPVRAGGLFWKELLAIQFCEQRFIADDSTYRTTAIDAFITGLSIGSDRSAPNHSEQVRVVPVEPTEAMRKAAQDKLASEGLMVTDWLIHTAYSAMLAAAPSAGSQKEKG